MKTAFHRAAASEAPHAAQLLDMLLARPELQHNDYRGLVNQPDRDGDPPLLVAAFGGNLAAVKAFLRAAPDSVNLINRQEVKKRNRKKKTKTTGKKERKKERKEERKKER